MFCEMTKTIKENNNQQENDKSFQEQELPENIHSLETPLKCTDPFEPESPVVGNNYYDNNI